MRARTILALGTFHPERRKRLETFAKETSFELILREDVEAALKWLEAHDPRMVLFDTIAPKAHTLCLKVRAKKSLTAVPIIGLARVLTDAAMARLFAAGADDVVPIFAREPLIHRLKAIPAEQSIHPPPDRGKALVADSDHDRCSVIGRTLIHAGYDVKFAVDRRALDHYARDPAIKLVVASAELGTPASMIEEARKAGGEDAIWIITDEERDASLGAEPVAGLQNAIRVSAYLPPESLLFLSNELMSPKLVSKRMSPRILHGTVVEFREAGGEQDDLGFTYNVSLKGVFIRTLAAPSYDDVWLDLRAPGTARRVRLEGRVVWRRAFSPGKFANTPPGFGVHIKAGLGDDVHRWTEAVEGLLAVSRKAPRLDEMLEETLRDSMVTAIEPPPVPLGTKGSQAPGAARKGPPPLPASAPPPAARPAPAPSTAPAAKRTMMGLGPVPAQLASDIPPPPKSSPPPLPPQPAITTAAPDQVTKSTPPPLPQQPPAAPAEPPSEAPATDTAPAAAPAGPQADAAPTPALPASAPRSSGRLFAMLGAGLLLLGVAGAAAFFLTRSPEPSATPIAAIPQPSALQAPSAQTPSSSTASGSSQAAPEPSAASASASASAAPAGSARAAAAADTGSDGKELLATEGYLVVTFAGEGEVYATGIKVGKTNEKNKARCGQKYVRVGKGDPPSWISGGTTVKIACQSVTKVTLTAK